MLGRQSELGGTVNLAKKPPLKERMQWIVDYYNGEFQRLGVEAKLNTEATADMIMEYKPDAVILATGSASIIPGNIPGIMSNNVFTVESVLSGKSALKGKRVSVIGAGLDTAEYLCEEGNQVTIIDMLDKPAPNANHTNVADVCGRLLNPMQIICWYIP